ncbi:phage/plasmid primase, P4 family [Streptomyces sp. NPDC048594]|uniref:phage/plasmid primase, P4 family n=1 Tax=Streptomyces sp. NPDC048594 TaxID=3365575 RepID=UPI00371F24A9
MRRPGGGNLRAPRNGIEPDHERNSYYHATSTRLCRLLQAYRRCGMKYIKPDTENGPETATDPLLVNALELAAQGVKVFPAHRVVGGECTCMDQGCKSPGKHPRTKNGSKEATTDEKQIRQWWAKWGKHGRLNFGQTLAGRAVVDVDVAEGKPGEAAWAALSADQAPVDTLTYRTGRGGVQHVFKLPEGEQGGKADGYSNALGDSGAVDFKTGPNAYVMVPGSKTEDVYTVTVDVDAATLPEWVAELARTAKPGKNGSVVAGRHGSKLADLITLLPSDPRRGNNWLTQIAGHYAKQYRDKKDLYLAHLAVMNAMSDDPIVQADFEKTCESIWNAEQAKTGGSAELPPPSQPYDVANALVAHYSAEGTRTLRHWRGTWVTYSGTHYRENTDQDLRNELYQRTGTAKYRAKNADGETEFRNWNPTRKTLGDLEDALKSVMGLRADVEPGQWLDGHDGPDGLIALENGLLDPFTGTLHPHTPGYFTTHALPFAYDPAATAPRWLSFLESAFPDDSAAIALLQEWFGYVVSGMTKHQKMMFLKGVRRSGKGTIVRVLELLVGKNNVAGPTFGTFATHFGAEGLIGKTLAVIGDSRTGKHTDTQGLIERFLTFTGGDRIDIPRKNQKVWSGFPSARIVINSNELPGFKDASGAITERVLMLVFTQSFAGREDITLGPTLATEVAGILNWALEGLVRLEKNGRFTEPDRSQRQLREFSEAVDGGITAFVNEMCELGEYVTGSPFMVPKDELAQAYHEFTDGPDFRDDEARHKAATSFGKKLNGAFPTVGTTRVRVNGKLTRVYTGIKLRQ